jgi:hypothetical protein
VVQKGGHGQLKEIPREDAAYDYNNNHQCNEVVAGPDKPMAGSSSSGFKRKAAFTTWT